MIYFPTKSPISMKLFSCCLFPTVWFLLYNSIKLMFADSKIVTHLVKYISYTLVFIGLCDHGTREISLPYWSYFSYTTTLFSSRYLCELFLSSACESVEENTAPLFWDAWWKVVFEIPLIWWTRSFMKMPPILYIGLSGVNFSKKLLGLVHWNNWYHSCF